MPAGRHRHSLSSMGSLRYVAGTAGRCYTLYLHPVDEDKMERKKKKERKKKDAKKIAQEGRPTEIVHVALAEDVETFYVSTSDRTTDGE